MRRAAMFGLGACSALCIGRTGTAYSSARASALCSARTSAPCSAAHSARTVMACDGTWSLAHTLKRTLLAGDDEVWTVKWRAHEPRTLDLQLFRETQYFGGLFPSSRVELGILRIKVCRSDPEVNDAGMPPHLRGCGDPSVTGKYIYLDTLFVRSCDGQGCKYTAEEQVSLAKKLTARLKDEMRARRIGYAEGGIFSGEQSMFEQCGFTMSTTRYLWVGLHVDVTEPAEPAHV